VTEELARSKAEFLGLPHAGRRLSDLVRAIQAREGYESCFDTGRASCVHTVCCWRESCLGRAVETPALDFQSTSVERARREARVSRAARRFARRLRRLERVGAP
jgi:hypothetical protein